MSDCDLRSVPRNLYPYLDDIAERLFSRHAAIMIGSGFSKNAKPHSYTSPDFPDWSELGDLFYRKLHHGNPDAHTRYLSVPALAHEVEAALGRPALNQLLRDAIPDQDYEPAQLHKDLLTLPWQDVFTTNYDTLLERACESLSSQRYDVVLGQDSLVYSEKPRIVKLHGTLSSSETLVVTDEDYRCYPHDFAPFVNTVRQTLLESTLCLIGFSGEDPNFLQWVGWLHDNLGLRNSPKMYLIGLPKLSDSRKKLLERRNILAVDMSAYSDIGTDDHDKALRRFVDYLQSRQSEFNRLSWPDGTHDSGPKTDGDIGAEIRRVLPTWRKERQAYPGWVVAPSDRRHSLWEATRNWIRHTPKPETIGQYPDLEFVFELLWRMERCLCPISDRQIGFLEETIDRHLPHVDLDDSAPGADTNAKEPTEKALSRTEIFDMCNYVLLAMMRYYRQEGRLDDWKACYQRVQSRPSQTSREHAARMYYERALLSLFELNPAEVEEVVDEWPVDESLPFWEAKRASLLAEIGRVSDAVRILKKSLATIRSRSNLRPVTTDYSAVSQEAAVMLVLKSAQDALELSAGKLPQWDRLRREFAERWESLRKFKCDPWGDLELFESVLEREPRYTPHVARRPAFEIGMITQTHYPMTYDGEALTAYRFLMFCEDSGIPFRVGSSVIATKSAAGTLSRIGLHTPYYAMATLVRIGDEKAVDRVYDRTSLVGWSTGDVDRLVDRYLGALDVMRTEIRSASTRWDQNMAIVSAKVIPEILSRLCCRCSRELKDRLLLFLQSTYQSEDRVKYGGIRNLTERLMEACSVDQRVESIPMFLALPVLDSLDVFTRDEYPNPFGFIGLRTSWIDRKVWLDDHRLRELLGSVGSDNPDERKWAVLTLALLHDWGILVEDIAEEFGDVLWSRLDETGFPEGTGFERSGFLSLPHSNDVEPVDLFRRWVADESFPVQQHGGRVRLDAPNTLCKEIIRGSGHVVWSQEEVCSIVRRIVAWWDHDKAYLKQSKPDLVEEFRSRFDTVVDALVAVIYPAFNLESEDTVRSDLRRIVAEFAAYGLYVVRLECACFHLFGEWRNRVIRTIEIEMGSSSKRLVADLLSGVRAIAERVHADSPDSEKDDLVRSVRAAARVIRWRSDADLTSAVSVMGDIVEKQPSVFCGAVEVMVLDGLHRLAEETVVHPVRDPLVATSEDPWDSAKKLALRRASAGLAYALFRLYAMRQVCVPNAIRQWEEICDSDAEFAEVRNQWIGIEGDKGGAT